MSSDLIAYCAIYCGNCEQRTAIPQRADALRRILRQTHPDNPEFARFLDPLAVVQAGCCRSGTCGSPNCAIRTCAQAKGVDYCPQCEQYPCPHIQTLAASEPTLVFDGLRLREVGVERWLTEQEERRAMGFCYGDIRCGRCNVPMAQ